MGLGKISIFTLMLMFSACGDGKGDATTPGTETNTTQVPLVIDGYTLPPMPDKALNDSTLLGIDSNDNGVRDDVEIYIYKRYKEGINYKIDRAIAMQYAKATQVTLIEPEKAYENKTYMLMENAGDCEWYHYDTHLKDATTYLEGRKYRQAHDVFDAEMKDVIFNTRMRLEAYMKFNDALSGHIFESTSPTKDKCDEDLSKV